MVGNRQSYGQRMGSPSPTREELHPELRPRVYAGHQAVIEHRQRSRLEHYPADLSLDVRAIGIPPPRAQHIARSKQFNALTAEHMHLT